MLWGSVNRWDLHVSGRQGWGQVPRGTAASSADITGDSVRMLRAEPDAVGTGTYRVVPFVQTSWKVLWARILGRGGYFVVTLLSHFIPRADILLPDYKTPRRGDRVAKADKCCSSGRCCWPGSPPLRPGRWGR